MVFVIQVDIWMFSPQGRISAPAVALTIAGGFGELVSILDGLSNIQLVPYGAGLVQFLISDGAVTVLLLIVLISQILLY